MKVRLSSFLMAQSVSMTHERIEFMQKSTAYPTRVAILDEHLPHAEHIAEKAAAPHHDATHDPSHDTPMAGIVRNGTESSAPIGLKCIYL